MVESISLGTAAYTAESKGLSVSDAIKNALNPNDRTSLAINLPNGISIPIGGPFRSAIRGLLPKYQNGEVVAPDLAQYLRSRLGPAAGTQLDIARNKDFQGNKIVKGGWAESLARFAEYEGEGMGLPLSAGAVAEGVRLGQGGKQIAQNAASQLAGTNATFERPYESRDITSRKMFDGKNYAELSPLQRQAVDEARGGKNTPTSDAGIKAAADSAALRNLNVGAQAEADAQYGKSIALPGQSQTTAPVEPKSMKDAQAWRDDYHKGQDQIRGQYDARNTLDPFTGKPYGSDMDKAIAEWGKAIDGATRGHTVDWEQVDAWRAANPKLDKLITEYETGKKNTDLTPMASAYKADVQKVAVSKYWEISDAVLGKWAKANNVPVPEGQTPQQFLADTEVEVRKRLKAKGLNDRDADLLASQLMGDLTESYTTAVTTVRKAFRDQKPEIVNLLIKWGWWDPGKEDTRKIIARDRVGAAP
jgi:hypothetical protein